MAGRFGSEASLIKAFQPHLLVFYGIVDFLSLDMNIMLVCHDIKNRGDVIAHMKGRGE